MPYREKTHTDKYKIEDVRYFVSFLLEAVSIDYAQRQNLENYICDFLDNRVDGIYDQVKEEFTGNIKELEKCIEKFKK